MRAACSRHRPCASCRLPARSRRRAWERKPSSSRPDPCRAAIYARERLGAGARIDGPAILTQLDATTLLLPGQAGIVDRFGNLIVEEEANSE